MLVQAAIAQLALCAWADAQTWVRSTVSDTADVASAVAAGDFDGDGHVDVLAASDGDDTVAWHANAAGDGSVWVAHVITSTADGARAVAAADLDGDLDAMAAAGTIDTIVRFQNVSGDGSSFVALDVFVGALDAESVFTADVDGDLDPDVLSASRLDDTVAWYRNPQAVVPYGSGLNPPGSLSVVSGSTSIGDALVVGLDNPLGTQAAPAFAILAVSLAPDPRFPAGLPLPNYGMTGPGAPGELLISFLPSDLVPPFFAGPPWMGVGQPAAVSLPIPNDPGLIDLDFYTQGVLLDPSVAFGVKFGLTAAPRATIGA